MKADRSYWLLFLVLLIGPFSLSQQDTGSPQLQQRFPQTPVETGRRIMLDVQATDRSGASVHGLQQQDFTVLDGRDPQKIVSFSEVMGASSTPNDPPAEVILVIDAVNASFQTVTYEREEIRKFLLENNGQLPHPLSFVIFSDKGTQVQNGSSRDGKTLATVYDQYQLGLRSITRSAGFYGATERFQLSIQTLGQLAAYEAKQPGRKLMIWVSPGWPMLSGPGVELTRKNQEQIFNSIVSVSTALRNADVTLYAIDPLALADAGGIRVSYYKGFLRGVSSPSHVEAGDLGLQVIAVQTGGQVLHSTNDLTKALEDCVVDANDFYVLGFDGIRADHPDEYHSLTVSVNKSGVTTRTRTGYYAQP